MDNHVAVADRVLPHNLEAERAVLSALLLGGVAADDLGLSPVHFFRDAHQRIFLSAQELSAKGSIVDLVTVKDSLARKNSLEDVGGPAYISSLVDGVAKTSNVTYYAEIVKEAATRRLLIFACNKLLQRSYDGDEDAGALLRRADADLMSIEKDTSGFKTEVADPDECVRRLAEELDRRNNSESAISGISTGLAALDEWTLGLHPGEITIVAARPSMGKSVLGSNIAKSAAMQGKTALLFSLEMKIEALELRLLADLSNVPMYSIQHRNLSDNQMRAIGEALELRRRLPLYIDDGRGLSVAEMRLKARKLKAQKGLDLIVIDYLQLAGSEGLKRTENRTNEVSGISRAIQHLAGELSVPIVPLSQLSRMPEGRKRPRLTDLRESGAIEQDADVVIFIHQEGDSETIVEGPTELIVAKGRQGPTGSVEVDFDRRYVRFRDASTAQSERVQEPPPPLEDSLPGMASDRPKGKPRKGRKPL